MKKRIGINIIFVLILIVFTNGHLQAEDKPNVYWYYVRVNEVKDTYNFYGSSLLDEKQFAKKLNNGEYVMLDNLVYYDNQMKIKSWSEWRQDLQPRVYLNPKYVIAFHPMLGDPRKKK